MKGNNKNSGAYRLFIQLSHKAILDVGSLGKHILPDGTYIYVGSAKRGLSQRVARHERVAQQKQGRCHWHIDRLLMHPASRMVKTEMINGGDECRLSREIECQDGVAVPIPGFGATDCKAGCKSHLYQLTINN